jgi:ribosomal protein S18 acetylase RimI-like enzyme
MGERSVHTARLSLLPYSAALVPRYHEWMADEALREATASERLALDEEFAAQREWAQDPSKQTFIVFDRAARSEADAAAGMCGDVNIFLMSEDAAEDYALPAVEPADEPAGAAAGTASAAATAAAVAMPMPTAEIMVMIAEPGQRRRGFASEAVRAMMVFALRARGVRRFVAKISDSNAPSLALFGRLGFRVARRMPHFQETHLAFEVASEAAQARLEAEAGVTLSEP